MAASSRSFTNPCVLIVTPGFGYAEMFQENGWDIVDNLNDADMVQFTGGADVSPYLYGQSEHISTNANRDRDNREQLIFNLARRKKMYMAGICRGGQFLNVMCGGSMFQHCDGHARGLGTHKATDIETGQEFNVTSTHHQMMDPSPFATQVLVATESTYKEKCYVPGKAVIVSAGNKVDIEACYYPDETCFCFQPHPEFAGHKAVAHLYMDYLYQFFYLPSNYHRI